MNPEIANEAQLEASRAREHVVALRDIRVDTAEDIELAGEILDDIRTKAKAVDARQKEITRPLNAALKSVRDLFRPAVSALAEAEAILKQKILQAKVDIERRRREAAEQMSRSLEAGRPVEAAATIIEAPVEATDTVAYRTLWEFEIVDIEALPRMYMVPDLTKIRATVQALKESAAIPGVRVYPREVVVAKGSR